MHYFSQALLYQLMYFSLDLAGRVCLCLQHLLMCEIETINFDIDNKCF